MSMPSCIFHPTKAAKCLCCHCGFICNETEEVYSQHSLIQFEGNISKYYYVMMMLYNCQLYSTYCRLLLASCTRQFQNHTAATYYGAFQMLRQNYINSKNPKQFARFIKCFLEKEILWISHISKNAYKQLYMIRATIKIKSFDQYIEYMKGNIHLLLGSPIQSSLHLPECMFNKLIQILLRRQIYKFEKLNSSNISSKYDCLIHNAIKYVVFLFDENAIELCNQASNMAKENSLEKADAYLMQSYLLEYNCKEEEAINLLIQSANIYNRYMDTDSTSNILIFNIYSFLNKLCTIKASKDSQLKYESSKLTCTCLLIPKLEKMAYINHNLLFLMHFDNGIQNFTYGRFMMAYTHLCNAYKEMKNQFQELWPCNYGAVLYFYIILSGYISHPCVIMDYVNEYILYLKYLHPLKLNSNVGVTVFYTLIIACNCYSTRAKIWNVEYCLRLLIKLMDSTTDYSIFASVFIKEIGVDLRKEFIKIEKDEIDFYEKHGNYLLTAFHLLLLGSLFRVQNQPNMAEEKYRGALFTFSQASNSKGMCLAYEFILSVSKRNKAKMLKILDEYKSHVINYQTSGHLISKLNKIIQDSHK